MECKQLRVKKEIIATTSRTMNLTNPSFCKFVIYLTNIEETEIFLQVLNLVYIHSVESCNFLLLIATNTLDKVYIWIVAEERECYKHAEFLRKVFVIVILVANEVFEFKLARSINCTIYIIRFTGALILLQMGYVTIKEVKSCTCRKEFYVVRIILLFTTTRNGLGYLVLFTYHRIPTLSVCSHHIETLVRILDSCVIIIEHHCNLGI